MKFSRTALLATLFASTALAAHAQQTDQRKPGPQQDAEAINEVVVTGSHIAQPNLEQPTPITQATPLLIENSGTANLGDILSELPSLGFDGTLRSNSNNYGNSYGISTADLRNLGTSRTLVLVDGYRHVAGDIGSDAVDLNSIPVALVDHVEVITGGASAIYGSDAVSGVLNIILKKKFDGVFLQAQGGVEQGGYGGQVSASGTVGHSWMDDKLHMDFTATYNHQQGVDQNQIPNYKNYGTVVNPADAQCAPDFSFCTNGKPNDGIPDTLWVQNVGSKFVTTNGVLLNANTLQPQYSFNAAGQLIPVPAQTGYNSFAFGQLPTNCQDCYFPSTYNQEASPFTQDGAEYRVSYDFTPHLRAFVDAKYNETYTFNRIQPSFSFGSFQLAPDNAFIPPALAAALAGTPAADYPYISKFLDNGRGFEAYRRTYRVVAGFTGDFNIPYFNIKWDSAINYGRTDAHFQNQNLEITDNFNNALDSVINPATGQPACRTSVPTAPQTGMGAGGAPGCIPYNPFGTNQLAGALAYSFGQFDAIDSLSQQDFTLNLNTDTSHFFKFPGGPLSVAAGTEYRMERTYEINDPRLIAGDTENLAANSAGGFNVIEGYVEGSAPIFHHNGFLLDELSLDAAYRGADYSYKQVGYADAYKFSGVYGPFSWIKARGTYSQAIRAPNITEAFSPTSSTYFNIADPCSAENIASNVNYAKNCAASGVPAGFQANTNASIIGQSGGNPNLAPEQSFSYTGGFVLQPTKNLSFTIDYYSIKIKDAITLVAAQDIIDNCYNESSGLSTQYCSLFTRNPTTHNINFVSTTYVNASKLYTDGVDVTASYTTLVEPLTSRFAYTNWLDGRITFDLNLNYLDQLRNFPFQNNPSQYHIEELTPGIPQWRFLANATYRQGSWQWVYTARYVGRVATFDRDLTQTDLSESSNEPFVSARFYHDIALHYFFKGGATDGLEIYGGVKNIFGDLPPAILIGSTSATTGFSADTAYDIGRYFFLGLRYRQ